MELKRAVGQQHITAHFETAIRMGRVSHAYIINGEKGSGKLILARDFAAALQCAENAEDKESPTGRACGVCESCRKMKSESQLDVKIVRHEKQSIGIDDVRRQINDDCMQIPISSRYSIYIVPDADKMTVEAQNALLKTLEDPPEYVIIMLLTNNANKLLPTIVSRSVVLNIRSVPDDIIIKELIEEYDISEYEADTAAAFSGGNPGRALWLATSEEFSDLKKIVVDSLKNIDKLGMKEILDYTKQMKGYRENIEEVFSMIRLFFRDVLVIKTMGDDGTIRFAECRNFESAIADNINLKNINEIFKEVDKAESRLNSNVNFENVIEMLYLKIKENLKGEQN